MGYTMTSRTRHGLVTSIVAAALVLTAGCTPEITDTTEPTNYPLSTPVRAIVAGGRDNDTFSGVAVASDGSIIAVGQTSSTDGDFPRSHGTRDALMVKYEPDLTQQWAITVGGNATDGFDAVAVASDGSIIAVGHTDSINGDFPPSHGKRDALIVKYSPEGTRQWAKTLGGSDDDAFFGVTVAGDDSIIAVGDTYSTDGDFPPSRGRSDALLVRYSPDGTQQWAKTTGGSTSDEFSSVAVADDGSIIAAGCASSPDGDFPPSQGAMDPLIVKYSPDGTQKWAKTLGGSGADFFTSVAVAKDGSLVAAGYVYSTDGDFPPRKGLSDAVIAKYGPDGTRQWVKTAGGSGDDDFNGVAVASDGSIIAVGTVSPTDVDLPPTHGVMDALMIKYEPDGTMRWAKTLGGADPDWFIHVTVAKDGNVMAVGLASSKDGDFPPSHGWSDALLVVLPPDL